MQKRVTVNPRIIRAVLNNNFTFSDLAKRFENVDSSTGNIFCPFHENHDTPAAKMYWDEVREIWVLHCFGECHWTYTAYDYVNLILCIQQEKYNSPLDFLRANMNPSELYNQIQLYKKQDIDLTQIAMQDKIDYINNIYAKHENLVDYIEELYTTTELKENQ